MAVDTVFNEGMRPVFVDEPEEVMRRLKATHPDSWTKVCIGSSGIIVTVDEYLYKDKYTTTVKMLEELLRKHDLAIYRRSPERLKIYVESTAKKMIELILGEK